jgi:hypothetical protein
MAMKQVWLVGLTIALAGCGGGGGGGGGGSASVTPFSTWSAITPNSTVRVEGSSQEVSYTADPVADLVTSVSAVSPNRDGAYYQASYGADGFANAVTIRSAEGTTINWSTANGDTITRIASGPYAGLNLALSAGEGANAALSAEPLLNGWNYQSFGVWITGRGQGSGTAGVVSVGSASPVNAIPQTGSATYIGSAGGIYTSPTGVYFLTASDMRADVNFGARQLNFQTTNTIGAAPSMITTSTPPVAVPGLNVNGTLTYAAGSNQFSGTVTSASSSNQTPMSGSAVGKFYGPAASEIGGTFSMTGAPGEVFAGAFGGKR